MSKDITREEVWNAIEKVEHPEIAVTLVDLGMVNDIAVRNDTAVVAMSLPTLAIPELVRDALVESIRKPIESLGLKMEVEFFEMTEEVRNKFFSLSKANWKGAI